MRQRQPANRVWRDNGLRVAGCNTKRVLHNLRHDTVNIMMVRRSEDLRTIADA
jgi:hypothetical protein